MYRISFVIATGLSLMTGCVEYARENKVISPNSTPTTNESGNGSTALPTGSPAQRLVAAKPDRSLYRSEPAYEGLYYFVSPNRDDERKLIISFSNEPISQKANDPDEVTEPGFYLSHFDRVDFSEIEVVGPRVHFKTRQFNGFVYEFRGVIKEKIDPNFDPETPVPGIAGVLKTISNGRIVKEEKVTLGHAVIA